MPDSPEAKAHTHTTLKEFIASIASIRGDLSNITAPPFVLDTKSVVELPAFWAERPSLFVAPAAASDPAERALLVLRWFLASLKNQQYGGRSEDEGVKKPLNAFLGECFLARWDAEHNEEEEEGIGETRLVSEQVSHHPPVTACRLWNEKHGVYAEGFTRQSITLALGTIAIKQVGHALLTLRTHGNETYLIPLPDVKVKGILSGLSGTYPELEGTYTIPCTSGYYSVIEFSGKSFLSGGKKNEFEAKVYASTENGGGQHDPIYTLAGHWNDSFTIWNGDTTTEEAAQRERIVLKDLPTTPLELVEPELAAQDPWESRRAWRGVADALNKGDMMAAAREKSVIEQGQRAMRKEEAREDRKWTPLFFQPEDDDPLAARLYRSILKDLKADATVAIWKFDDERWRQGVPNPFHGNLTPDNTTTTTTTNNNNDNNDNDKGAAEHDVIPNGHMVVVVPPRLGQVDGEDVSSPASFWTAREFPFPDAPQRKAPEKPQTQSPSQTPQAQTQPQTLAASLPIHHKTESSNTIPSPPSPPAPPAPPADAASPAPAPTTALAPAPVPVVAPPKTPPPPTTTKAATDSKFSVKSLRRTITPPNATPSPNSNNNRPRTPSTSGGDVTPSSSSISPSTRRGKRQKARESIGKFRSSLSTGLHKIPGVGSSPARSDAGN